VEATESFKKGKGEIMERSNKVAAGAWTDSHKVIHQTPVK
jgi:hypothetical protein